MGRIGGSIRNSRAISSGLACGSGVCACFSCVSSNAIGLGCSCEKGRSSGCSNCSCNRNRAQTGLGEVTPVTTVTTPDFLKNFGLWFLNPFDWNPPAIPGQKSNVVNPTIVDQLQKPVEILDCVPGSPGCAVINTVETVSDAASNLNIPLIIGGGLLTVIAFAIITKHH